MSAPKIIISVRGERIAIRGTYLKIAKLEDEADQDLNCIRNPFSNERLEPIQFVQIIPI